MLLISKVWQYFSDFENLLDYLSNLLARVLIALWRNCVLPGS